MSNIRLAVASLVGILAVGASLSATSIGPHQGVGVVLGEALSGAPTPVKVWFPAGRRQGTAREAATPSRSSNPA